MHIKNTQKNADASVMGSVDTERRDGGYLAISGRDYSARLVWNGPLWIAEKP